MKRDMDLVRDLLLQIEQAPTPRNFEDLVADSDEKQREFTAYHMQMLVEEAGLVRGADASSGDGRDWLSLELTWEGHEFLDAVRDSEIWRRTKEGAEKAGGFTMDLLMELAKGYIKTEIKKRTGVDI